MTFNDFLLSIGLMPKSVDAGKWQRCPTTNHPRKKNGHYKLADDGLIGWAIDYAIHADFLTWRPEGATAAKVDYAAIARREAKERREAEAATEAAIEHYRKSKPLNGTHPYLESKGLNVAGCGGLRVDDKGRLLIPMLVGDKMTSIQAITPDGDKRFWPGAKTAGARYVIGSGMMTILCEGFATGLTLWRAIPTAQVIVAFNAGNLLRVAESLTRKGMMVVAADNDHGTQAKIGINPGIERAKEAAEALGVGYAYPTCTGTDWDDYRQERIKALSEVEALKRRPKRLADIEATVNTEIAIAVKREAKLVRAR